MNTCTRRLEIDAAHRLLNHEGKCRNYHGHRYVFDITVTADALDDVGRIIDFGVVKQLVGGWLDEKWDHGIILQQGDPMLAWLDTCGITPAPKHFVLVLPPTAENLARYMYQVATSLLLPMGVRVINVRCWETPGCWADYGDVR